MNVFERMKERADGRRVNRTAVGVNDEKLLEWMGIGHPLASPYRRSPILRA